MALYLTQAMTSQACVSSSSMGEQNLSISRLTGQPYCIKNES